MIDEKPHNELGLNDAARGIRNGSFSSEELVLACLDRIQQREKSVGAWIYLDEDQALEQARECTGQNQKVRSMAFRGNQGHPIPGICPPATVLRFMRGINPLTIHPV